MNYYVINHENVKKVDKKTYLKLNNQRLSRDYITWYDDGCNVFIGVCNMNENYVIDVILQTVGVLKAEYIMWK
jgi:hypothetical protein